MSKYSSHLFAINEFFGPNLNDRVTNNTFTLKGLIFDDQHKYTPVSDKLDADAREIMRSGIVPEKYQTSFNPKPHKHHDDDDEDDHKSHMFKKHHGDDDDDEEEDHDEDEDD